MNLNSAAIARAMLFALLSWLVGGAADAQPWNTMENLCAPDAVGVPGDSGQPPDWWSAPNADRNDPRWRGAALRTWGVGTSGAAILRSLHKNISGVTHLYLSFDVPFDPSLDVGSDVLVVTLASLTTEHRLIVYPISDQMAHVAVTAQSLEYATRASGTTDWTAAAVPAWLNQTRVWVETDGMGNNAWTVQVRVPVSGPGSLNLPADFGLFTDLLVRTSGGTPQHKWPRSAPDISEVFGAPDFHNQLPPVNTWGQGSIGGGCTGGVSLAWNQIGTTNADPHTINLTSPNTFFARPQNGTSTDIMSGQMSARFRLANWGVMPPGGAWRTITTAALGLTVPAGNATPAGALEAAWTVPAAERPFYTANPHQCILVELEATIDLDFDNASVVRNMDFVAASSFERDSQISALGLGDPPDGQTAHRIWLFLEKRHFPGFDFGAWLSDSFASLFRVFRRKTPGPSAEGGQFAAAQAVGWSAQARTGPDPDAQARAENWPTYRLHVYRETGRFVTVGDRSPVLELIGSYGYFVRHEGPLTGWASALEGAERVGPNVYVLDLAKDATATLRDSITAQEGSPFWAVLILLLLLALLIIVIRWLRRRP